MSTSFATPPVPMINPFPAERGPLNIDRPASDKATKYAVALINERETFRLNAATWRPLVMALLEGHPAEAHDVSILIDVLKGLPRKEARTPDGRPDMPGVAAGRYALRDLEGYKNEIAFFKIDRPEQGRWAGRTFVKQFSSDNELPVRGEGARKVLELIARDPKTAMILFGQHTSTCGHCGRRLTDDESRARGIGPVCAEKMGW